MNQPALTLENIRFRYHAENGYVVDDISLEIPCQKVTAILGPNGAGKTSLLHLLLGLLQPQGGRVLVKGKPHQEYSKRELAQWVGLVPQVETIPFNFSVFEYVVLGRSPYLEPFQTPREADFQIVNQIFDELDLAHLRYKPVTELSGGERQMVQIARALAQQTKILLLDEPTTHLDLGNQNRILNVLGGLAAQGITILFTTHDPNVAAFFADHVLLMDNGHVVEYGNVDETLTEEKLSAMYRVSIQVERQNGRLMVMMGRLGNQGLGN